MVGLGFGCALRGFERRVWSVTLWGFFLLLFLFVVFPFFSFFLFVSVFLLFSFLSFFLFVFVFCLMSSDAKEHNY